MQPEKARKYTEHPQIQRKNVRKSKNKKAAPTNLLNCLLKIPYGRNTTLVAWHKKKPPHRSVDGLKNVLFVARGRLELPTLRL